MGVNMNIYKKKDGECRMYKQFEAMFSGNCFRGFNNKIGPFIYLLVFGFICYEHTWYIYKT